MKDGVLPKENIPKEQVREQAKTEILKLLEKHELDIESISQNLTGMKAQIDQIPNVISQVVIETLQQIAQQQQGSQETASTQQTKQGYVSNSFTQLDPQTKGQVIDKILEKVLNKVLPDSPQQGLLGIDENWLKEEVVSAFKEDLSLGKEIRQSIKRALISKQGRATMLKTLDHGIE